ncbi:MAG: hypothetical protein U0L48_09505, partial [Acutalibacteraceae bacterium]|nr:hypothetical protein [Acutalibacteraceae bacterium]
PYKIDTGDNTYYDQGLKDATQLINDHEGKNKKQLILFVSDGAPNDPNDSTFKGCVENLIKAASNNGTNEVYFYSVGIGLLDAHGGTVQTDRSYYLNRLVHHANNTTITGDTVTKVSAARYINITDSEQFANDVTSAIYEASSNAGIYFDKLSDYFAFPDTPTGTLTITNSDNTEKSYRFSGAEFTFENGQSITIDRTNKTIKWAIPDKSVNSKLTFDVVVDKGSYLTYNELYKSLNNGANGKIATNSEAYFEFGSDSHADIISPELDYQVEKAAPILSKDARWAQNYMTTGLADITLGVHDPEFSTGSTTSTSADVTILLDRSDSMTGSYMYLSAVKSAKEKEEEVAGAQGPNSDGKAGEDPVDVLYAGGYDACANENHLYVYKGKQFTEGWVTDEAGTLKNKIVKYANVCAGNSNPSPSEVGCLPLTNIDTVKRYFGDKNDPLKIDIDEAENTFTINRLTSGDFTTTGWTIENGKYTALGDDGWVVLNIHKFINYCASTNGVGALTEKELTTLRAAS